MMASRWNRGAAGGIMLAFVCTPITPTVAA
jgi:hypothetical protein